MKIQLIFNDADSQTFLDWSFGSEKEQFTAFGFADKEQLKTAIELLTERLVAESARLVEMVAESQNEDS